VKPYDTGHTIVGLADAEAMDGVTVYRYAVDELGRAAGGRVVSVTALGSTIAAARDRAYEAVDRINWHGMQFRTDIAAGE
jgi:phosphoribosylamine---glycine ligase